MSCVVKRRYEFHVGCEATHDNEDVKMTAARWREGAESVNSDCHERFVSLGRCKFGNRNGGTRFILLAVATRLDKTDDMRLETVPGVAISPEKLESDVGPSSGCDGLGE